MKLRCLAVALSVLGPLRAASGEISLAPAVVQLAGKAGQSTTQRLTIRNDTPVALSFALEAQDVVVRAGHREFVAAGEIPASIAATAIFSQRAVEVPPQGSRSVGVTLTLPPGVQHRAVVALFRGTTRVGDARAGSTASLGTLLTFTMSDQVSLDAGELQATPPSASANLTFVQPVKNGGTEPVVTKGAAVVLDGTGAMVARVPFVPRRVLPGERTVLRTEYPGELPRGRYRALATFEYEGRSITRTTDLVVQ